MNAVTKAVLDYEYPLLLKRAARAGWEVTLDEDSLSLLVRITHANARDKYVLRGDLKDYNRIPPAWTFVEPDTGLVGTYRAFPARSSQRPAIACIFTEFNRPGTATIPIICLPCNRLCYKEHTGIHSEWPLANWMDLEPRYTTLVEMVERIHTDLQASGGPWLARG